jgi:hypothetical protein
MCTSLRFAAVIAAAALAGVYVALSAEAGSSTSRAAIFEPSPPAAITIVDRAHKTDRLPPSLQGNNGATVIATVEIVGLPDAAVVYRDRDGRVLFRTDPMSNATVVVKGVVVHKVTVRETLPPVPQATPAAIGAGPLPENPPASGVQQRSKVLDGCEPAFSPLVASTEDNFTGRCVAERTRPVQVAATIR